MSGVKPEQTGIALVLVLWLLTLLTILAAGYSYTMRTETKLTIHGVELAKARAIAEAGLWLAVADLLKPQLQRQWLTDGTLYKLDFGGGQIHLRLQDEAGRIDLNTADGALLRGLLEKAAQPGDDVDFMLNAILDWRNPGAEDGDYEYAGYSAKGAPFNSIEELRLVAGMTNDIFARIYPTLTLHSRQQGIHPQVAPREVLLSLTGADEEQIDAFLLARSNRNESVPLQPGIDNRFFSGASGIAFSITSEGITGHSKLKLDVVITLIQDARLPYSVLSWRESKPVYNETQAAGINQGILPDGH